MTPKFIFTSALLSWLLLSCQTGGRNGLKKEIQSAHIVEEQEKAAYAKALAYFESVSGEETFPNTEITRINGRAKTSDSGWRIVRYIEEQSVDKKALHDDLFGSAARFGLENWLYTVVQAVEPAWLPSLRDAAKVATQPPSPFLPASMRE